MKRPYYATSVGKHTDERKAFLKKYRDFQYPANEEAIAELLSCCFCFAENRLKKEAYDLCYTGDKEAAEREAKRIVTAVKWEIASFNMKHRPMVLSATAQDEDDERETAQNRACAVLGAGQEHAEGQESLHRRLQTNNACYTFRQQKPPIMDGLTIPLGTVILKIPKRHCRQTVDPLVCNHEMTAYFVRVRRSFRIYSEYVEQNCNAYKETKEFLAHTQHPLPQRKGSTACHL